MIFNREKYSSNWSILQTLFYRKSAQLLRRTIHQKFQQFEVFNLGVWLIISPLNSTDCVWLMLMITTSSLTFSYTRTRQKVYPPLSQIDTLVYFKETLNSTWLRHPKRKWDTKIWDRGGNGYNSLKFSLTKCYKEEIKLSKDLPDATLLFCSWVRQVMMT